MGIFKILAFCILAVMAAAGTLADSGSTTLLATSETFQAGVTADLFLETREGTGRVFIESSPLTKIDTQISTRFAKEIACSYSEKDCSRIDFFYTINADATIIGGPSAGAAMAALTVGVLEKTKLNPSVAITGTINSGNIIGHVGGIPEKIEAASDAGIKKVLIPKGEVLGFAGNKSIDAIEYGNATGVEVIEVFSLDEVMSEFTGKTYGQDNNSILVDPRYSEVMGELAESLCKRTGEFEIEIAGIDKEVEEFAKNLSRQGFKEKEIGSYYSAASFCFGANVRYKYIELNSRNPAEEEIVSGVERIRGQIDKFEAGLENASTVSDAQTLAIILDRVDEARQHANISIAALNADKRDNSIFELAFAIERLESADAWSSFLGAMKESEISGEMIKNACVNKIAEARERVEYSAILIGSSSDNAAALLGEAQAFLDRENYVQCLHKATISKSEANMLLGVLGIRDDEVLPIVERKIKTAERIIARQSEKGIFPIVGYSYYEYAKSLKETDKYSALLFSEYALEFSNLDIYFRSFEAAAPEESPEGEGWDLNPSYMIISFLLGIIFSFLFFGEKRRRKGRILVRKAAKTAKRQ